MIEVWGNDWGIALGTGPRGGELAAGGWRGIYEAGNQGRKYGVRTIAGAVASDGGEKAVAGKPYAYFWKHGSVAMEMLSPLRYHDVEVHPEGGITGGYTAILLMSRNTW